MELEVHPVPALIHVQRDETELELDLLIREARRRRRRRRLRLALVALIALGITSPVTGAISGWFSATAITGSQAAGPAGVAGAPCPVSPARFVSNSQFDALVIGSGRIRLGIGNQYNARQRKIVVRPAGVRGWAGIEAIWWMTAPVVHGPVTVRGAALGKHRPIEVQPSQDGLGPGSGPLTLPSDFQPAPGASAYPAAYPGELWVRTGGCYALSIHARGFSERLVFDVLALSK